MGPSQITASIGIGEAMALLATWQFLRPLNKVLEAPQHVTITYIIIDATTASSLKRACSFGSTALETYEQFSVMRLARLTAASKEHKATTWRLSMIRCIQKKRMLQAPEHIQIKT